MTIIAISTICLLSQSFSHVVLGLDAGNSSSINDIKVQEFLSVARVVKDVDQLGGARKILEHPQFQDLPTPVLQALHGLVEIEEQQRNANKTNVRPRFLTGMFQWGVTTLLQAISNMVAPKATTDDPDMNI